MCKLRIGEVAKRFGVSPETVRNWDREGKIKSTRTLGNHRRFEQKDYEKNLVEDVLAILIVYSSKIYGRRSHEKRRKACRS